MSKEENELSSVERAKLNQELKAYGYVRENISFDKFPETLIPIIISFMNCILDLVYDKTINQGKYTWYSDKQIELEHYDWVEGEGGVAIIDQVFNKKLCKNFRIDFQVTWEESEEPEQPEKPDDDPFFGMYGSQTLTPAFRVGYLTKLDDDMRNNLNGVIAYEQLGKKDYTYGIGVDRKGIAKYVNAKYIRHDYDIQFDKKMEQEDIISLFFSFESYKSSIYHNYKKVGDCFEHEIHAIDNIYPAISMWSWEAQAMVARVEILKGILNVEE